MRMIRPLVIMVASHHVYVIFQGFTYMARILYEVDNYNSGPSDLMHGSLFSVLFIKVCLVSIMD